jgi:hypothetical protein
MTDNRPAFARFLWRDHTQEHWAYSLSVEVLGELMWLSTVLGAAYYFRSYWVPLVIEGLCQ